MKKYFNFALFALAALLFTGCSNEENVTDNTDKADPAGTIGFSFPMNKDGVTYAGTTTNGTVDAANPNESIIRNVHIYMFKNSDGKLIDWQTFTAEDIYTNGSKALFDVTGVAAATPCTFYAVANADSYISSTTLGGIVNGTTTLTQFKQIISNNTGKTHLKAEADKGLLMTGYRDVANVLAPTAAEKVINLKRRVARFDVVNKETDGTLLNLGGTNFKITAIYVSKANYAGYITAEVNTGATIPIGNLDALSYTGTNDGAENKSVLYLWPTVVDKLQQKTVISIEGIFNGQKQLFVVKPATDINIQGNFRYTLKVNRIDLNTIDFDIVVDKWEDGGSISGDQNKVATVISALTNPTAGAGGVFKSTTDGTTVNYDGSDATGTAVLQVTTTSHRSGATNYTVSNYNGTGNAGTNILIERNEAVTYAGALYTTIFKITIPKQTTPVDRKITIVDAFDANNKKEIIIKVNPNYVGTSLKPVLVGGKYWAPVNVGATTNVATTLNQASCGSYYQWGRNKGFAYGVSGDELAGPVSFVNATTGTHKDKFITSIDYPYNWLDNTYTQAQKDALWSGANAQGPCPMGWGVPTGDDFWGLAVKSSPANISANRLSIPGDGGVGTLYLPAAGFRSEFNGSYHVQGVDGYYWSSSVSAAAANSFVFFANGIIVNPTNRAPGIPVRCVQK